MFFRRRAVVVLPLFLAVACGGEATGAAPETTERATATTQTTSTRPTVAGVPPIEQWVSMTEPGTGVTFALPTAATPEVGEASADGSRHDRTLYEVEVTVGTSLAVQFVRTPGVEYIAPALELDLDQLVEGLTANAGVSAVIVPTRQATTVAGRPALNYKVNYTEDGTRWHLYGQLIGEGSTLISVFNVANFAPAQANAGQVRFLEYHRLVVENLKFP